MKKLAIVHTSFALVETLDKLAKSTLPGIGLLTIVDDTVLPYARQHGVDEELNERMLGYFRAAEAGGADAILNVCSSVGETVDAARGLLSTPILKIDEPMAQAAVTTGERIAVLATVSSTLEPTSRLLENTAREAGRNVQLTPHLCEGAFEALTSGRPEEHDRLVTKTVLEAAREHEVIVLAQASMARLAPEAARRVAVPVLSSPGLAMRRLAEMLEMPLVRQK